ncbi:MAG: hypothetical protein ACI8X5_000158 [Planctomycetota bacterium]|jgi:hypothetical protein
MSGTEKNSPSGEAEPSQHARRVMLQRERKPILGAGNCAGAAEEVARGVPTPRSLRCASNLA